MCLQTLGEGEYLPGVEAQRNSKFLHLSRLNNSMSRSFPYEDIKQYPHHRWWIYQYPSLYVCRWFSCRVRSKFQSFNFQKPCRKMQLVSMRKCWKSLMGVGLMLCQPWNVDRIKELLETGLNWSSSWKKTKCHHQMKKIAGFLPLVAAQTFRWCQKNSRVSLSWLSLMPILSGVQALGICLSFELKEFENKWPQTTLVNLEEPELTWFLFGGFLNHVSYYLAASELSTFIPNLHNFKAWVRMLGMLVPSGVTIHWVDSGVDTGKVLKQKYAYHD